MVTRYIGTQICLRGPCAKSYDRLHVRHRAPQVYHAARRRGRGLAAKARAQQQPAMPAIGFLSGASPDVCAVRLRAFRQGLKEARGDRIEYVVYFGAWVRG